jgi:hypothetical protein
MKYESIKNQDVELDVSRVEDEVVDQVETLIRKYGSKTIEAAVSIINEQLEHEITGNENHIILAGMEAHLTYNRDNGLEVSQGIQRAMRTLPESLR